MGRCNGTIKMEATGLQIWMTGIEMMGTGMMSNHKYGVCSYLTIHCWVGNLALKRTLTAPYAQARISEPEQSDA